LYHLWGLSSTVCTSAIIIHLEETARIIRALGIHRLATDHNIDAIAGMDAGSLEGVGAHEGTNDVGCILSLRFRDKLSQGGIEGTETGHAFVERIPSLRNS
jgi:predicted oxidoreductase